MYEPDSILELKEQRDPDEETGEAFPYNRVRVVGPSPVNHGVRSAEWTGADGQGVIITPLSNFGSVLDEPYGKLRDLYTVVEIPVREGPVQAPVRVINSTTAAAGPTPEEVFAQEAPGVKRDGDRASARKSPLEDRRPAPGHDGPLDKPKGRGRRGA